MYSCVCVCVCVCVFVSECEMTYAMTGNNVYESSLAEVIAHSSEAISVLSSSAPATSPFSCIF